MEKVPEIITVVCTGNICRSPMAARLLKHALEAEEEPLRSCEVLSAGISAACGLPASENAVKALKTVGLDLVGHRSQPFSRQLAEKSDLVLVMTTGHLRAVQAEFPGMQAPLYRFREWVAAGSREVTDPFGGPLDLYVETRDNLAEAVPSVIKFLKSKL